MNLFPETGKVEKVEKKRDGRIPYETPAVIYEGVISTRAGSPPNRFPGGSGGDGVDPADLFGNS